MATADLRREQQLLLHDVPWRKYLRLMSDVEEYHVRVTYDRGALELMTLSHEHENEAYLLGRLVDVLTEELGLPVKGGKSTTFKRRKSVKGLEADGSWWIQNEASVRGKKTIDLRVDPPPDLAMEIDISRSSLDRLKIYAALGFPEIWQFDGTNLKFHLLEENRKYVVHEESRAFAGLRSTDVLPFLSRHRDADETTVIREFRLWVRERFGPRTV